MYIILHCCWQGGRILLKLGSKKMLGRGLEDESPLARSRGGVTDDVSRENGVLRAQKLSYLQIKN
jgi:hypothetical protein